MAAYPPPVVYDPNFNSSNFSRAFLTQAELNAAIEGLAPKNDAQLTGITTIENADITTLNVTGSMSGITKADVGLGNVDNTSDLNKPISTATQTALNGKLNTTGGTLSGTLTVANIVAGSATITPTELSCVDGATSNFQTQINNKLATSQGTVVGLAYDNGGNTPDLNWLYSLKNTANTFGAITTNTQPGNSSLDAVNCNNNAAAMGFMWRVINAAANGFQSNPMTLTKDGILTVLNYISAAVTIPAGKLLTLLGDIYISPTISISPTELSYLDGVTSNIQTQINAKASNVSGTFTTCTLNNCTMNSSTLASCYFEGALAANSVDTYLSGRTIPLRYLYVSYRARSAGFYYLAAGDPNLPFGWSTSGPTYPILTPCVALPETIVVAANFNVTIPSSSDYDYGTGANGKTLYILMKGNGLSVTLHSSDGFWVNGSLQSTYTYGTDNRMAKLIYMVGIETTPRWFVIDYHL